MPFISIACFCSFELAAQQSPKIDSLKNLLQACEHDTTEVILQNELSKEYRDVSLDTAEYVARNANVLAKRINFARGIGLTFNSIGVVYYYRGDFSKAGIFYDSSLRYLEKTTFLKETAFVLNNLGVLYETTRDFDKAVLYHERSLGLREKINDVKGIGDSYNNIGLVHYARGDYAKAIKYLTKSLEIDQRLHNHVDVASSYVNIGTIQILLGNYDIALNNLHTSLGIFQKNKLFEHAALCYTDIANVYVELNDLVKATYFFYLSLRGHEQVGNKPEIGVAFFNLGKTYAGRKLADSAYFFLDKSLQYAQQGSDNALMGKVYHALASLRMEEGNFKNAEELLTKSIALKTSVEDHAALVTSFLSLGELYAKQKKYSMAMANYSIALKKSKQLGTRDHLDDVYLAIAALYKRQSDYKRSLEFTENYLSVKDSLMSEAKQRQIIAMGVKYEIERKEEQIARQQLNLERQALIVQTQSTQRNFLIAAVVLIAIILFLAVRNYKTRLRTKEMVNLKNKEFEIMRSYFFANISHEFRTPLTLIMGPLRQMVDRQEVDFNSLKMVVRNSERLERLISQLLDLSKFEAGKMQVEKKTSDLLSLARSVASTFVLMAEKKNIRYEQFIPAGMIAAKFDQDKVEKIMYNLLSNAFKFTEKEGQVSIAMKLDEGRCTIEVSDTGRGIPASELENIFERFHRSWAEGKLEYEGSGIGLALTKDMVEVVGGNIGVNSKEGEGSVFTVQLPLEVVEHLPHYEVSEKHTAQHAEEEMPAESDAHSGKPIVLIVEDNIDLRKYIGSCLGDEYRTLEAENGKKGLALCEAEIPDMIISDLMMPEMDGMEFCKKIRKAEATTHIPFIMLTARADDESKISGLTLGADDYLVKPFHAGELSVKVRNSIERRKQLQEKLRKQLLMEPTPLDILSADETFLFKVKGFIEQKMAEPELSVESLSHEVALSRVQLYRKVLSLTGVSVNELIRSIRLKRACQLMDKRWGTVSEIAYEVGFNNLSYFAKCFKAEYGSTPSEYMAESKSA